HPKAEVTRQLYPRLLKCAQAGALATETKLETIFLGGQVELLPNDALERVMKANLVKLNDLQYTADEQKFAARIQSTLTDPPPLDSITRVEGAASSVSMGSTDVGDVSWVVPTAGCTVACFVPGT